MNRSFRQLIKQNAEYSRDFLKLHGVYRYRMKKVNEMNDEEVNRKCHFYCEENNLVDEWHDFIETKINAENNSVDNNNIDNNNIGNNNRPC